MALYAVGAYLASVALFAGFWARPAYGQVVRSRLDLRVNCGVRSLYILGTCLGRQWTFTEVCEAFASEPTALDVSAQEVIDAANRLGLTLVARRMNAREAAGLRCPVIVLIPPGDGEGVGHFDVARPVGDRGGVWQVLDPDATPMLTSPYSLFGRGRLVVLVPVDQGGITWAVGSIALLVASVAIFAMLCREQIARGVLRTFRATA